MREIGFRQLRTAEIYRPELREELVANFGDDGAWLLLSLDHYSWRAHYDLAVTLVAGATQGSGHEAAHLQSMVDLQVQSSLYAVAEQFARLVLACCAHEPATSAFFDAYMQRRDVVNLIGALQTVGTADLRAALRVPTRVDDVRRMLRQAGQNESRAAVREIIASLDDLVASFAATARLLTVLTERPPVQGRDDLSQAHTLRRVDNAFRHGLKVLYFEVVPRPRAFRALVSENALRPESQHMVELYQADTEPKFATVHAHPDRTQGHLDEIKNLSVMVRQLTRGMIYTHGASTPAALIGLLGMGMDDESAHA